MDIVYVPISGKSILATRISELFVKGENIPERVVFQINGQTPEFCYLMYKRIGDASPYIITLEKSYAEGVTSLLWKPSIHFCAKQGAVEIQLIAFARIFVSKTNRINSFFHLTLQISRRERE